MIKASFKPFAVSGLLGCAVMALSSTEARAASTATITSITAEWTDVNPGSGISVNNSNSNRPIISWGQPATFLGKSKYVFNTNATPLQFDAGASGILGTFSHYNRPITGTSLTSATLKLTFEGEITDSGSQVGTFGTSSLYEFTHEETPNSDSPCPYQPNSWAGCSDKVTVTNAEFGKSFSMDGKQYVFSLDGFETDSGPVAEFITKEKWKNHATLQASLIEGGDVPVPEIDATAGMGSLAALGAMLAFVRGRRRQNAA